MKTTIPLHCLVLAARPEYLSPFPAYERLLRVQLAHDLFGGIRNSEIDGSLIEELRNRVDIKLRFGERAAVFTGDLSDTDRRRLVAVADAYHVPVVEITDYAVDLVPASHATSIDKLRTKWKGVTVIADVHGNLEALEHALEWARSRQHFAYLLGDVVDYGSDTLLVADRVYRAVMQGGAAFLMGNHERKIIRWLAQRETGRVTLRLSEGNRITVSALDRLKPIERRRWIGRFRALIGQATLIQSLGRVVLAHAAVHSSFWHSPVQEHIDQYALYGESDFSSGRYRQTRKWVDAVPADHTVIVGHEMMSALPMVLKSKLGGQVVFLDTGCGKGGQLSTADLRFSDHDLHLECFNRH